MLELLHELREYDDDGSLAAAAADFVVERSRQCVERTGTFTFAVSGGRTPWAMFAELTSRDVAWEHVVLYQVDDRIAPAGSSERNLTNLMASLGAVRPRIEPLPVNDDDLDAGARRYGAALPEHFDLLHLGLGPDGHTASLVPSDPVLDVTDRLIAVTELYQERRRMTMTYPALTRADQVLWLITGIDKRAALTKLLRGDTSIPAGRVLVSQSLIMADRSAIGP